jgi:hypothetical protein
VVHTCRAVLCLLAMAAVLVGCADSAPGERGVANRSATATSQEPYRIVGPPFVEGPPSHLWVFVRLNRDLPQTRTQDGLEQDGRPITLVTIRGTTQPSDQIVNADFFIDGGGLAIGPRAFGPPSAHCYVGEIDNKTPPPTLRTPHDGQQVRLRVHIDGVKPDLTAAATLTEHSSSSAVARARYSALGCDGPDASPPVIGTYSIDGGR